MLELKNIYKSFNQIRVLQGINLNVDAGKVYGLIGANGAGKTTLMNIITGILKADNGDIMLNGKKINGAKDIVGKVGYMLDIPAMFDFMNAYEFLEYLASGQRLQKEQFMNKANELLQMVGLSNVGLKKISSYSRGMKQRMGIAAGMINDPMLILMDEPTSALDPVGRYEVIEIIKNLRARGKTVLLSTHILSDVEKVCDKIGIVQRGSITIEGTIKQVFETYNKPIYDITPKNASDINAICQKLSDMPFVEKVKSNEEAIRVLIEDTDDANVKLFDAVSKIQVPLVSIVNLRITLEEIFLKEANA